VRRFDRPSQRGGYVRLGTGLSPTSFSPFATLITRRLDRPSQRGGYVRLGTGVLPTSLSPFATLVTRRFDRPARTSGFVRLGTGLAPASFSAFATLVTRRFDRPARPPGYVRVGNIRVPPPPPIPFATPTPIVRDALPRLRRRPGWILRWPPANIAEAQAVWYHVYANTGQGDPINYATPIATVDGLSWRSPPLAYPGDWRFGVRAFYDRNGLEEQNLDCAVEIILDGSGNDITNRPGPPTGLRALAVAGGNIKVEWSYPNPPSAAKTPVGFHVYIGVGSLSYASPVASVSYASAIMNSFMAALTGLLNGTAYTIGVRAYNATAEEPNTVTVNCMSDASGPTAVQCLKGLAV
jgi:hypothetical protein